MVERGPLRLAQSFIHFRDDILQILYNYIKTYLPWKSSQTSTNVVQI